MTSTDTSPLFGNRNFVALFVAQLLGFLNDNIFKTMVSLIAVGLVGAGQGSGVLSLVSIVFLVPYLLFSGYAGYASDVFGNRIVLIVTKAAEVLIVVLAIGALWLQRMEPLLGVLFLLAAQATFFSPAKYSMVREIAPAAALQRANGLLEVGRFGAIIVGTVLGGVLLAWHAAYPVLAGAVLLGIAVAGTAALFCMTPGGAPIPAKRPIRMNPWMEIGGGMRLIAQDARLRSAVAGLCFFEAMGALLLLDVVLIGHDALRLDSAATGLLGAFIGIGLAGGSLLAGHCAGRSVQVGMVPFGIAGVGLAVILLVLSPHSFAATAAVLLLVGVCGAFCLVPLTALLQRCARSGERGQIIATNNFLCMGSVMIVSCGLWLIQKLVVIDPWVVLLLCGLVALAWTLLVLRWFPGYAVAARIWGARLLRKAGIRRGFLGAAPLALALLLSPAPLKQAEAATLPAAETHRYSVIHSLFGEIGRYEQRVQSSGAEVIVESSLQVRVTVLFSAIVLHDLRSSAREVWRDGRLVEYAIVTDEDGDITAIRGAAQQDGFAVSGPCGEVRLPPEIRPLSPWSIALTKATLLISPETGALRRVVIAKAAPQLLASGKASLLAQHFVARGDETFELWYDGDGQPAKFTIEAAGGTVTFLRDQAR